MPTSLAPTPSLAHLQDFVRRELKPAWIKVGRGGPTIYFWCNPQTYTEKSEVIKIETPTLAGMIRTSFGTRPRLITLQGTTGTAGWDSGDHGTMKELDRLKPYEGHQDVQMEVHFPYMFEGPLYCYVNSVQQETRPEAPLYYFYTIELAAYPLSGHMCDQLAPGTTPQVTLIGGSPTPTGMSGAASGPTTQAGLPPQTWAGTLS